MGAQMGVQIGVHMGVHMGIQKEVQKGVQKGSRRGPDGAQFKRGSSRGSRLRGLHFVPTQCKQVCRCCCSKFVNSLLTFLVCERVYC